MITTKLAVIFDMDGLLLDSERVYRKAFQNALAAFSIPPQDHIYELTIGLRYDASVEMMKGQLESMLDFEAFLVRLHREQDLAFSQPIPVKQGVPEVVQLCLEAGIPFAVATSTHTSTARARLRTSGIGDHFETVIGADLVQHGKPEPDVYLKAAATLGIPPGSCIAFEDSDNGVRAALAAGMMVVQVPDLKPPADDILQMGHVVAEDIIAGARRVGLDDR